MTLLFSKFKTLGRDMFLYGTTSILQRSVQFVYLPLVARLLSKSEFGAYTLLISMTFIVSTLVDFGMNSAILRFAVDWGSESQGGTQCRSRFVAIARSFVSLVLSVALGLIGLWVLRNHDIEGVTLADLILVICIAYFSMAVEFRCSFYRTMFRPGLFAITKLAISILNLLLLYLYCQAYGSAITVQGVLLTQAFPAALISAVILMGDLAVATSTDRFGWRLGVDEFFRMARFGLPLVPHQLGQWGRTIADRFLVASNLGLVVAASYNLSLSLVAGASSLVLVMDMAYGPWVYHQLKGENLGGELSVVRVFNRVLMALSILGCLVVISIAGYVIDLVGGGKFPEDSVFYLKLATVQIFIYVGYVIALKPLMFHRRTRDVALVTTLTSVGCVILVYVMIGYVDLAYVIVLLDLANLAMVFKLTLMAKNVCGNLAEPWLLVLGSITLMVSSIF